MYFPTTPIVTSEGWSPEKIQKTMRGAKNAQDSAVITQAITVADSLCPGSGSSDEREFAVGFLLGAYRKE